MSYRNPVLVLTTAKHDRRHILTIGVLTKVAPLA